MSAAAPPALIGTGSALPEQVRSNDDPIFDWLKQNVPDGSKLFTGYDQRRVLGPGETVTEFMVAAASAAIVKANIKPAQIDLLLGYGSVAEYITPNTLAQVHAEIGLPASTQVLPLADDFTNWGSGVVIADALIRAGRIERALIVCGDNWTQHVNYHKPESISAGDGAGATIVGPATDPSQWRLVARAQLTATQYYGDMFMAGDPLPTGGFSAPVMHITPAGYQAFGDFGANQAATFAGEFLKANNVAPADVTMICHQASAGLFTAWTQALPGITILDTLLLYGNIVLAAIPVNLDQLGAQIKTDRLLVLGLGEQLHAGALLFERG